MAEAWRVVVTWGFHVYEKVGTVIAIALAYASYIYIILYLFIYIWGEHTYCIYTYLYEEKKLYISPVVRTIDMG